MSARTIAVVTGGAGFIGSHMVDLLLDARLSRARRSTIWSAAARPISPITRPIRDLDVRLAATSAACSRTSRCFADVDYVFHFAGIGDIVPSIERPIEYMDDQRAGHGARAGMRARTPGSSKFVYAASSSCYGLAATPTREDHPIDAAISLRAVASIRASRRRSTGTGSTAAGQFDPHLQRLWHARAHHGRLWRGVRRVLQAEARRQAVHGRRRRHPDAAISSTSPTSPTRFCAAAETDMTGEDLEPRRRQSADRSIGWSSCSAATVVHIPEAAGRARLHLGRHRQDPARSRLAAEGRRSRKASRRMLADIEHWRDAPLWDPESIAQATPRPGFEYLGDKPSAA